MNQYDTFLSKDNFYLAFFRLKTASRSFYKTLYYEDLRIFENFLDANVETVLSFIKEGIYKPQSGYKYFIPKRNDLIRPIGLLTFIDLLVYQALANSISDSSLNVIGPYYNNIIFGNVINTSQDKLNRRFFFKNWKNQWKRFKELSREYFKEGYNIISEFDIASFFDTIDHTILLEILRNEFKIEDPILLLLQGCLETWTCDASHKAFKCTHGIPQGPIASSLLADLYLFYLDTRIIQKRSFFDFYYIRYVDDIRIFSKEEIVGKKIIALLDLESRDLGLIPQGGKISSKPLNDIEGLLLEQNDLFSDITKEYKEDNPNKPKGKLKSKTHKRLKKSFMDCFDQTDIKNYLNKTIIKFSLFKLNEDDEVKEKLISSFDIMPLHIEEVMFYFSTHYKTDNDVIDFFTKKVKSTTLLFPHIIALILKSFPELPFDYTLYKKYFLSENRHWLIKYFMIHWLYKNQKQELLSERIDENYFVNREKNYRKFGSTNLSDVKQIQISILLESTDNMIALQGLQLLSEDFSMFRQLNQDRATNPFISSILTGEVTDFVNYSLSFYWEILNSAKVFNQIIWKDAAIYTELNLSFKLFFTNQGLDYSKALMNLNLFNQLVFDTICDYLNIRRPAEEYGSNLKSNLLSSCLPICNQYWTEINEKRNQKTDAHPYDKTGRIRVRITKAELALLVENQKKCMKELCDHFSWLSLRIPHNTSLHRTV